jgi:hypothetical protein
VIVCAIWLPGFPLTGKITPEEALGRRALSKGRALFPPRWAGALHVVAQALPFDNALLPEPLPIQTDTEGLGSQTTAFICKNVHGPYIRSESSSKKRMFEAHPHPLHSPCLEAGPPLPVSYFAKHGQTSSTIAIGCPAALLLIKTSNSL